MLVSSTQKLSFFQLQFIFVVLYCIGGVTLQELGMSAIVNLDIDEVPELSGSAWWITLIFNLLPICLFLFFIMAIALHRNNIHIVTSKNIFLLAILALLLLGIHYLVNRLFFFIYLINSLISSLLQQAQLTNVMISVSGLVSFIASVILYGLSGVFGCYFIRITQQYFNKSENPLIFTEKNKIKMQFILFLIVFLFIASYFCFFLMDLILREDGGWAYCISFFLLIGILITILFSKLQSISFPWPLGDVVTIIGNAVIGDVTISNIVKCAVRANALILILNYLLFMLGALVDPIMELHFFNRSIDIFIYTIRSLDIILSLLIIWKSFVTKFSYRFDLLLGQVLLILSIFCYLRMLS